MAPGTIQYYFVPNLFKITSWRDAFKRAMESNQEFYLIQHAGDYWYSTDQIAWFSISKRMYKKIKKMPKVITIINMDI